MHGNPASGSYHEASTLLGLREELHWGLESFRFSWFMVFSWELWSMSCYFMEFPQLKEKGQQSSSGMLIKLSTLYSGLKTTNLNWCRFFPIDRFHIFPCIFLCPILFYWCKDDPSLREKNPKATETQYCWKGSCPLSFLGFLQFAWVNFLIKLWGEIFLETLGLLNSNSPTWLKQ